MDFIVEKDIRLLISLDGDEEGQSYRVDHTGRNFFLASYSQHQIITRKNIRIILIS